MKQIKDHIHHSLKTALPEIKSIVTQLYQHPEIGGEEKFASALLTSFLRKNGFDVEENYHGINYAFRASYYSGKAGPSIAIFAEYDALPSIGHGCGHNLICATSVGAAAALKSAMNELCGKIIVYGTPGEENLQTKSVMAPEGAFDEADAAMMVHPEPSITTIHCKTLAVESFQIEFFGKSSHAALAPEKSISALDAAVTFYQMVSIEKQYFLNTNVYGIINDGGEKASVIPDYASLKFLTRAWDMDTLAKLKDMLHRCAEAAAKMTGCTFNMYNNENTNACMNSNKTMAAVFEKHLAETGETDIKNIDLPASTDMGDVSQRIPSIHPWLSLRCPDANLHSEEFCLQTQSDYAEEYLFKAASALALTAAEILSDSNLLAAIKEEFNSQR